jgi:hypothetical protein
MGETTLVEVKQQKKARCGTFQIGIVVFLVVALAVGLALGFTIKPAAESNAATVPAASSNKKSPPAVNPEAQKPPRPAMYDKLVPPGDKVYTGFHLDWSSERPSTIVNFLEGRKPAIL